MKTLPSIKESILSLFEYMALRFDGEKYHDLDVTYQFVFTDIDMGFPMYFTCSQGKAEYREGFHESPSVTIRTESQVWLDISGGFRNPLWALMTKKYKVEGKLSYLKMLPRLLTKKVDVPQSRTFPDRWIQPEKVLVLMGNPRKKNGLTLFYLQPFLEGMKSRGASVEEIHLYDKEIRPCLGCFHCWTKTPGLCVQKDDQRELIEKLDHADLIVYALPLYYHSVPGKVKNHLDRQIARMHPFFEKNGELTRHPRRVQKKQSLVLFSVSGFPEIKQFDALVTMFEAYARHDNVSFIGKVLIPGAMELYYNPTHRSILLDKLNHLRSAGERVVRKGYIEKGTVRRISKIPNSLDEWRSGANWHWYKEMEEGTHRS